ncbi:hypothetical protein ACUNV4_10915 [Granulosicoccus sp. 3-233]|uniref:hypothetical protein n=1 Tax=Granulosicoccus sp. 3-233 TaxID=3417969 RepID=UPI003D352B8A
MLHSEEHAILLHDIRAAMLNHSGLHKEVQDSLVQLTEVLQCLVPAGEGEHGEKSSCDVEGLKQQVNELLVEDVEQCMPMLQLSSDRLSRLLSTMVRDVIPARAGGDAATPSD